MNRVLSLVVLAALLSGCASTRYTVVSIRSGADGTETAIRVDRFTGQAWQLSCGRWDPVQEREEWEEAIAKTRAATEPPSELDRMSLEDLKARLLELVEQCAVLSQKHDALSAQYEKAEAVCEEAEGEARLAALRRLAELKIECLVAEAAAGDVCQQLGAVEGVIYAKVGAVSGFGGRSRLVRACQSSTEVSAK